MKPILFNTEMMRANIAGLKTNTRRLVKPLPPPRGPGEKAVPYKGEDGRYSSFNVYSEKNGELVYTSAPYKQPYEVGDILYVRENWAYDSPPTADGHPVAVYMADYSDKELAELRQKHFRWRPSIHMPKELARLFLRVTDVWVERLQEIDEKQAMAEGVRRIDEWPDTGRFTYDAEYRAGHVWSSARECFRALWDSTVRPEEMETCSWNANPWVWVIEYEQCEKPEGE